jgi:hypothetical protein
MGGQRKWAADAFVPGDRRWEETIGCRRNPLARRQFSHQLHSFAGQDIVNQTFVKTLFNAVDPIGRTFEKVNPFGSRQLCRVIGVVPDATYSSLHVMNCTRSTQEKSRV